MKDFYQKKNKWLLGTSIFVLILLIFIVCIYCFPLKNIVYAFDYTKEEYIEQSDGFVKLWPNSDIQKDFEQGTNKNRYVQFEKKSIALKNNKKYYLQVENDNTLGSKNFQVLVCKQKEIQEPQIMYVMPRQFHYGADVSKIFKGVNFKLDGDKIIAKHKTNKKMTTFYVNQYIESYLNHQDKNVNINFSCDQLYVVFVPENFDIQVEVALSNE